ncbi:hypothetical protein G9A89_009177 [Geosiphon pyriformis]|nr:hypothetical protein G9A89_009177 [Geosiphon pyriformis]
MFSKIKKWRKEYKNFKKLSNAKKKSKIFFPDVAIKIVMGYIDSQDIRTLHSCVLLNRVWCQNAIEFLWKRPFHRFVQPSPKLVPIYFSFLTYEQKDLCGIAGNSGYFDEPASFDYPSFLKELDMIELRESIKAWRNLTEIEGDYIAKRQFELQNAHLFQALLSLFMTRSKGLEFLNLDKEFSYLEEMLPPLTSILNLGQQSLKFLPRLEFNNQDFKADLLQTFAALSRNLRAIKCHGKNVDNFENFRTLFTGQIALEKFIMIGHQNPGPLFELLATQSNSLKYVKIKDNCLMRHSPPLFGLAACQNLVALKFQNCSTITSAHLRPLAKAQFPFLEKLEFINFNSHLDTQELPFREIAKIIKKAQSTLRKVSLGVDVLRADEHRYFYPNVLLHCINISKLTLFVHSSSEVFIPLRYLKNFWRLEELVIVSYSFDLRTLLPTLAEVKPTSLKRLHFKFNSDKWELSTEAFRDFLDNCRPMLHYITIDTTIDINWKPYESILRTYNAGRGNIRKMNHPKPWKFAIGHLQVTRVVIDFQNSYKAAKAKLLLRQSITPKFIKFFKAIINQKRFSRDKKLKMPMIKRKAYKSSEIKASEKYTD